MREWNQRRRRRGQADLHDYAMLGLVVVGGLVAWFAVSQLDVGMGGLGGIIAVLVVFFFVLNAKVSS